MFQQFALVVQQGRQTLITRSDLISTFFHDTKNGFLATLRYFFTGLGLATFALFATALVKPEVIDTVKTLSPFEINQDATPEIKAAPDLAMLMATPEQAAQLAATETGLDDRQTLGNQREQQLITNWLAKRYHVANDAANMLVSASYLTAKEVKIDPILILSVMAIESGFNPFAESPVGAQGLMQVMSKVHQEKFQEMGGIKAALNPVANIKVGALILKDYVTRGGSVEAGLKLYVGAAEFETDSGYGSRVLTEYRRLKDVATGKNVPTFFAPPTPVTVNRKPEVIDTKAPAVEPTKEAVKEQVAALS